MVEPRLREADETSDDQQTRYGEYYYTHDCGTPYERNEHWSSFFGGIADAIVRELQPTSVLDVGCALGILVEELRVRGVEAWGIDVSEYAIDHVHPSVAEYCAVSTAAERELPEGFPASFDLVTCIEVIEHLEDSDVLPALNNLTTYSDRLLFSSSPEDYTEATHLNVKSPDQWSARLAAMGMWRNLDIDASFLTPWAAVYDRHKPVPPELVAAYERAYVLQRREIRALRAEALRRHADDVQASANPAESNAELRRLLDASTSDTESARARMAELEEQLTGAQLAELSARDHTIGAEALAGELRAQVARLEAELTEARLEMERRDRTVRNLFDQVEGMQDAVAHRDAMLYSETWRIGAAIVSPLRLIRRRRHDSRTS